MSAITLYAVAGIVGAVLGQMDMMDGPSGELMPSIFGALVMMSIVYVILESRA